jgi:L-Ala-D/L-Glu epimerase
VTRRLSVRDERWPIAGAFKISRGTRTESHVIVAEIAQDGRVGRGEAVPYARYGANVPGELRQIETVRAAVEAGASRGDLQGLLPPGSARNALDAALWDLEAKLTGRRAWELAGRSRLDPVKTAFTIGLDTPEVMAEAARAAARRPLLKLKIGGADDLDRVESVRAAAPKSRLIVDANEALTFPDLQRLAPEFARLSVLLIEQPLPRGEDEALEGFASPVMLCADESLHDRADLPAVARRYGCVNVKLDKTGGLTEALALVAEARALRLEIMVGCIVGTSLAMAPALILAQGADFVDLDGPLILARDREPGLVYEGSMIRPPSSELWG